ncbi:MAG: hypothetical protein PV362_02585 [Providencia heimbachae]|nr:hypothetical protein [Providencia heimbachae]
MKEDLIKLTRQIKSESLEAMNSMDDDHLNYPAELIYKICDELLKYKQLTPYAWEYRNARGLNFTKDKNQIEFVKEYCPDANIIKLFKLDDV